MAKHYDVETNIDEQYKQKANITGIVGANVSQIAKGIRFFTDSDRAIWALPIWDVSASIRPAITYKRGQFTALAVADVWVPAAGKFIVLYGWSLGIFSDSATAGGNQLINSIQGSGATGEISRVSAQLPGVAAATTVGASRTTSLYPNFIKMEKDEKLQYNPNVALSAGGAIVEAWGIETSF